MLIICSEILKIIDEREVYKLFSNQNQLKDTSDVHFLNNYISTTCRTILKINFQNFAKSFVKKMLTLS